MRKMIDKRWLMSLLMVLGLSINAHAAEEDVKTKESDKWHWDMQVHFGTAIYSGPLKYVEQEEAIDYLEVAITFDLYYKGFFIQSNRRRSNPTDIDIGYQVAADENWAVDAIIKSYFEDVSVRDLEKSNATHLDTRQDGIGYALRYSHYLDDAIVSVDLATIHFDDSDNAWVLDSFYSHLIPYRNWDIYLGAGFTLFSANTVNYYVGIDKADVKGRITEYRPGAGYKLEAEAHAIYPLAEDWTMRFGITKSYLSDNFSNSPIGIRSNTTYIKLGVNYVF